ncbi:BON domain-containing protein [Singulisphaera sp. GP187]|uniref:BON domain-containing protein n=1 Tax=Singulisphaera sp. GP187 TaxID=1882752 RepID=UPI00092801FB|nr:BON domain-containing protein [Singulisphaera sp. GP187]SIO61318.1 BON domain-containing protein [Singulisphaera sp. GP187]
MTISLSPTSDREPQARPGPSLEVGLGHEAERRLCESGYLALRDVSVSSESHAGTLWLRGRLPTYYLKQVAQSIVSEIEGVNQVVNHIDVVAPAGRSPLGHEAEGTLDTTGSNALARTLQPWEASSPFASPEGNWARSWS